MKNINQFNSSSTVLNQKVASDMNLLLKTAHKLESHKISQAEQKKCCQCSVCGEKCACEKCSDCVGCQEKKKEAGKVFSILNKIAEHFDLAGMEKSAQKNLQLLKVLSKEASEHEDLDNLLLQEKLDELAELDLDLDGEVEEDIGSIDDQRKKELEMQADEFLAAHPEENEGEDDIFSLSNDMEEFDPEENTLGENTEDLLNEHLDMQKFDKKYQDLENITNLRAPEKHLYRGILYEPEFFSDERMDDLNNEIARAKQRKAAGQKLNNKLAGFDEWMDDQKLFSDKDFETDEDEEGEDESLKLEEIPTNFKSKKYQPKINQFQQKKKKKDLLRQILEETPIVYKPTKSELDPSKDAVDHFDEFQEPEEYLDFHNYEDGLDPENSLDPNDENFADDGFDGEEKCGTCGLDHIELEYLTEEQLKNALQSHKDAGDYEALGVEVPDFLLEDENDISDNLKRETDEVLWNLKGPGTKGRNVRRISDLAKNKQKLPSELYFNEDEPETEFDFSFGGNFDEDYELEKYSPEDLVDQETRRPAANFDKPNYDWEPEDPHLTRRDTYLMMPKASPVPVDLDDEEELISTERKPTLIDDMKAANRKLDQMLKVLAKETSKGDEDFENEE